jgi:similar to stage IV sporulation protein
MSHLQLELTKRSESDKSIEALLTTLTQNGIPLHAIKPQTDDKLLIQIQLSDYYKLRPLFRASGCTWRIKRRWGMAFLPNRISRRLFFVLGAFLFLTSLYVLSSLIWRVEVEGETQISHAHIREMAEAEGLYRGQWKPRVASPEMIAKALESKMPEVAWIGVTYTGTKAHIHVVDRTLPEKVTPKQPQHIVATHDAVVTNISATKGTPVVQPNDRVVRGGILISGIVGDEEHVALVPAEGEVRGLVWYTQTVVVPLHVTDNRLTGKHLDQTFIRLFNYDLKIKGYRQKAFNQQQTIREKQSFHFMGIRFALPIYKQRQWQTVQVKTKRTIAQAREIAMMEAKRTLLRKLDKDAVIRERKLLHENSRGGKVYINIHVEVEQAITKETEIIDRSING